MAAIGFVQYGRHRGSPSWLPREIGRRWLYLPLVQKWCLCETAFQTLRAVVMEARVGFSQRKHY